MGIGGAYSGYPLASRLPISEVPAAIRKLILEPWQARLHRRSPCSGSKRRPSGWDDYEIVRRPTHTASSVWPCPCRFGHGHFLHQRQFLEDGHGSPRSYRRHCGHGNHHAVPLYRRVSRDTGGTAATSLALPVAVPHISSDSAATATLTLPHRQPNDRRFLAVAYGALLLTFPSPRPLVAGSM